MTRTTEDFLVDLLEVYEALEKEAEQEGDRLIWRGAITKWFGKKGISIEVYSKVMQALNGMGCLTKLTSGNRFFPTEYIINFPPTMELFLKAQQEGSFTKTKRTKLHDQDQRLKDINERLNIMETKIDILWEERNLKLEN